MMKKKILLTIMTMAVSIVTAWGIATQTQASITPDKPTCDNLVINMVTSIQNKDWNQYIDLMSYEDREFYQSYFNNDAYQDGVKQIKHIELVSMEELSLEQVEKELLYEEYPILDTPGDIVPYFVELDCRVEEENVFFYNGINYYLVVLAREEDGKYKVAQFNRPSIELAENVMEVRKSRSNNYYKNSECSSGAIKFVKYDTSR